MMRVAAAMKWVPLKVDVDPLTGSVRTDDRFSGASDADKAALEWGLRLATAWGAAFTVVCAGPPGAEAMLREAVAAAGGPGAGCAVRLDLPLGASSSRAAEALAGELAGFDLVLCGDYSRDRGSGSVPALVAAHLGVAQACGLVALEAEAPGRLLVDRRLDGGRRERLRLQTPALVSVEGSTARLRRAPLPSVLTGHRAEVVVRPLSSTASAPSAAERTVATGPFRPRARMLDGPPPELSPEERVRLLFGTEGGRASAEQYTEDPPAAAERILQTLTAWGYLEPDPAQAPPG